MSLKEVYIAKNRMNGTESATPPFPEKLKIDVCNSCNYSCIFCPTAIQEKRGNIDENLCLRIIKDAYFAGARELGITSTGEPLLNPNLPKYIKFAKDLGYEYVFVNTNGYMLDEKLSQSLLLSGIDSVKVSFNAGMRETYRLVHGIDGFDRVVSNVKNFYNIKGNCKLYLSYCVIKQTEKEVPAFMEQFTGFSDDILVFNANSRGGSDIDKTLLLGNDDYSFEYPCGQLFKTVVTTAEGYMVVCCQDFDKMTVIADLNKVSIVDAWHSEAFLQFRQRHINKDFSGTICNNCLREGKGREVIPLNASVAHYPQSQKKIDDVKARTEVLIHKQH